MTGQRALLIAVPAVFLAAFGLTRATSGAGRHSEEVAGSADGARPAGPTGDGGGRFARSSKRSLRPRYRGRPTALDVDRGSGDTSQLGAELSEEPIDFGTLMERDRFAGKEINDSLFLERQRMWDCTEESLSGVPQEQRQRLEFWITMDVTTSNGAARVDVLDGTFPDDLPASVQDCYLRAWDKVEFDSELGSEYAYRVEYPVITWRR